VKNAIKKSIEGGIKLAEPLIPGGYILLSRRLIESEIWNKPPLYLKVWIFLLSKAQHGNFKGLKRGQLWVTYDDIIEGCSWKVGARLEKPNKDQIYKILTFLRNPDERGYESDTKATMITTSKATRGMLINIDNYDYYQTHSNYESDDESDNEKATKEVRKRQSSDTINKNVKNDKNINNIYSVLDNYTSDDNLRQALKDFLEMRKKIKKPMTERAFDMLLKKLDELAATNDMKIKLIDQSILHNWQTVYPLKEQKQQDKSSNAKPNKFHNFTPNDDYTGEDLERIARERFEKRLKDLGLNASKEGEE